MNILCVRMTPGDSIVREFNWHNWRTKQFKLGSAQICPSSASCNDCSHHLHIGFPRTCSATMKGAIIMDSVVIAAF